MQTYSWGASSYLPYSVADLGAGASRPYTFKGLKPYSVGALKQKIKSNKPGQI